MGIYGKNEYVRRYKLELMDIYGLLIDKYHVNIIFERKRKNKIHSTYLWLFIYCESDTFLRSIIYNRLIFHFEFAIMMNLNGSLRQKILKLNILFMFVTNW